MLFKDLMPALKKWTEDEIKDELAYFEMLVETRAQRMKDLGFDERINGAIMNAQAKADACSDELKDRELADSTCPACGHKELEFIAYEKYNNHWEERVHCGNCDCILG